MDQQGMTEVGGGITALGWKYLLGIAGGTGIAAALAAFVVMCMTRPRTDKEWAVALVTTLMSSLCGGAAFIRYFDLTVWADDIFGVVGIIGIVFACGLPGWAVVRWAFNYMNKNQGKDLKEIWDDFRT